MLKIKYTEKLERYTIKNEAYDRVVKKLREIDIELKLHLQEFINKS